METMKLLWCSFHEGIYNIRLTGFIMEQSQFVFVYISPFLEKCSFDFELVLIHSFLFAWLAIPRAQLSHNIHNKGLILL